MNVAVQTALLCNLKFIKLDSPIESPTPALNCTSLAQQNVYVDSNEYKTNSTTQHHRGA